MCPEVGHLPPLWAKYLIHKLGLNYKLNILAWLTPLQKNNCKKFFDSLLAKKLIQHTPLKVLASKIIRKSEQQSQIKHSQAQSLKHKLGEFQVNIFHTQGTED